MKVIFKGGHSGIVHYEAGGAKHIFGNVSGYTEKDIPDRQAKALIAKYPDAFDLESEPAPKVPRKPKKPEPHVQESKGE